MKLLTYVFSILLFLPIISYSGPPGDTVGGIFNTDVLGLVDISNTQLSGYYDLRSRSSFFQVTNFSNVNQIIHVQIFQHDRGCDELNFDDELTPNDTVIYDLDNIVRNNGSSVPINLADNSYGYVVITKVTPGNNFTDPPPALIGNFRIVDAAGYEYRTNLVSPDRRADVDIDTGNLIANFNTVDGANQADVVGYGYRGESFSTVTNLDNGFSFDIFTYDMDEEPLSCDRRNFACGNVMNYGVNEDYPNSRGGPLLCPGGGLANPNGGFIQFQNGSNDDLDPSFGVDQFTGFIGINNGDGTGSMDTWIFSEGFDLEN